MKKIEVFLRYEKETPGTIRYQEPVTEDGTPPRLRTLYLPKWVTGNPAPQSIKVTVEEVSTMGKAT